MPNLAVDMIAREDRIDQVITGDARLGNVITKNPGYFNGAFFFCLCRIAERRIVNAKGDLGTKRIGGTEIDPNRSILIDP